MKQIVFRQIPVEDSADTYENIIGLIEYLEQGFEIISAVPTAGSVQYILTPAEPSQPVKRAYNTAKLPRAKHGVINTKRHSFEITPELHKEMLQTLAKYTADTGIKISASEFIRKAIAREIREFKR